MQGLVLKALCAVLIFKALNVFLYSNLVFNKELFYLKCIWMTCSGMKSELVSVSVSWLVSNSLSGFLNFEQKRYEF